MGHTRNQKRKYESKNINESTIKKKYEIQQKLSSEGFINTLILQSKKSKISKSFRFKKLEKAEQTKPKMYKRNEILKNRV